MILFAVDLVHSGCVDPHGEEIRYLLSVHFQRAGLPSRNLPYLPDSPTAMAAAREARAAGDMRALRVLGQDDGAWLAAMEDSWREDSRRLARARL